MKRLMSYHFLEKELLLGLLLLGLGVLLGGKALQQGGDRLRSTGCVPERHDGHDSVHSGNTDHLLGDVHQPAVAEQWAAG
jgi:hypothetical protein